MREVSCYWKQKSLAASGETWGSIEGWPLPACILAGRDPRDKLPFFSALKSLVHASHKPNPKIHRAKEPTSVFHEGTIMKNPRHRVGQECRESHRSKWRTCTVILCPSSKILADLVNL
jgi:hypothetical protein